MRHACAAGRQALPLPFTHNLFPLLPQTIPPLPFPTSSQAPPPQDFSDEVLRVIASAPNVCKQIHMPAQSGSTAVLERMR